MSSKKDRITKTAEPKDVFKSFHLMEKTTNEPLIRVGVKKERFE